MDNKFPGKDISDSDLKDKFPLSSSLNKKKIIKINDDISFGGDVVPIISGPNGIENKDLIFKCCEVQCKDLVYSSVSQFSWSYPRKALS